MINDKSLESFINWCDEMMIAEEGNPKTEGFAKALKDNKSSFTSEITIGTRIIPIKYSGYKGCDDNEQKTIKSIVSILLSKLAHESIALLVLKSHYKPEEIKKIRTKATIMKSIYVKEIKISGSGSKIKFDAIIQDDYQKKSFTLSSIGSSVNEIVGKQQSTMKIIGMMAGSPIDLQNQHVQQMINQQMNQIAVNNAINASLNSAAFSMGMPAGSFGTF